ncbi:MAG: hypothetical protein RSA55_08310 [Clostridia bacterium]
MDRSKLDLEKQLSAIKASILDCRLTHAQMCQTLFTEIDKELSKPVEEVDMGYVNACQNFIECLCKEKASQVQSHSEKNYTAIKKKLHARARKKIAFRVAVAAVCVMVMLFTAAILVATRRIDTSVSQNHERVIVQGTVIAPNTVDNWEWVNANWADTIYGVPTSMSCHRP